MTHVDADRLLAADVPPHGIAYVDNVQIERDQAQTWDAADLRHDFVGHDAAQLAAAFTANLSRREDPEDDGSLRLDIAPDAPWSRVVEVVEAAGKAGYRKVHFAFAAPPPVTPPPTTAMTDRYFRGDKSIVDEVWGRCKQVPAYLEDRSLLMDATARADAARAVPKAVAACRCAADIVAVREWLWLKTVAAGKHIGAVTIELGGTDAFELKQDGETSWRVAATALQAAARQGKPVRLAK